MSKPSNWQKAGERKRQQESGVRAGKEFEFPAHKQ